jgi:hypothetical protein
VDLYNSGTGAWSTAQLSVGRIYIQATSVGNVALFAGGFASGALLSREGGGLMCCVRGECFHAVPYCGPACSATACSLIRDTADGPSKAVDVYNSATGAWSTAQLSVSRYYHAATSVGNVALFAGGFFAAGALM